MISIHTLTRRVTQKDYSTVDIDVISIHTLTRRVTERIGGMEVDINISIHTLTRRVTMIKFTATVRQQKFQSTPSHGG